LIHRLLELGFDAGPPLQAVGLSLETLNHPHARIERQQLSLALQNLAKATGRSDLGFELGSLINITTADVVGQLLLSSPTLAEGLTRTSQYFALLTPSYRLQVESTPTTYRLRCEPTEPLPYDVAFIGLEILAVGLHRMLTFVTQEKSVPAKLEVSWPPPAHASRYRELKGLQVRFGASERPRFVMELAATLVEAPLPMANPLAVKDIEEACRRMLDEVTSARSWVAWVSTMLRGVEGHFPSQGELAAMLRILSRTLARGLEAEGCEYRALASSIRHERARVLLRHTDLPLAEIADRLGYSDAANFSRAYRKLEGRSPGEHRHAQRSRARSPRQS
jgi:AraC-like DNA-binding protein